MSPTFSTPAHPGSLSSAASARLAVLPRRDTAPERHVRRLLHLAGYRYRVALPVPGHRRRSIDIAFTRVKVAVFIDGCFWHCCPTHGTQPSANEPWWRTKLSNNVARDRDTDALLGAAGWTVHRFWEHDDPVDVARAVMAAIGRARC